MSKVVLCSGPGCGWEPDDVFVCALCRRPCCYCLGFSDDMPGLCDSCVYRLNRERRAATPSDGSKE